MELSEKAREDYNQNAHHYQTFATIKKKLSEFYTILKQLQIASTNGAQGLKILDIGSGTGEFMQELLQHNAEFVAGIDISESMLSLARPLLASYPESAYSLSTGDAFDPGVLQSLYGETKFDCITVNWVIGYSGTTERLGGFFAACKNLLKPGGKIFGCCTNESVIDYPEESYGKVTPILCTYDKIIKHGDDFATCTVSMLNHSSGEKMFETVHNVYRRQCLRRLLEDNGFSNISFATMEVSSEIFNHGMTMEDFRGYTEEIGLYSYFLASS